MRNGFRGSISRTLGKMVRFVPRTRRRLFTALALVGLLVFVALPLAWPVFAGKHSPKIATPTSTTTTTTSTTGAPPTFVVNVPPVTVVPGPGTHTERVERQPEIRIIREDNTTTTSTTTTTAPKAATTTTTSFLCLAGRLC